MRTFTAPSLPRDWAGFGGGFYYDLGSRQPPPHYMGKQEVAGGFPGSFRTSAPVLLKPGVEPYPQPLILFKQSLLFEVAGLACTVSVNSALVAGHLEGHG